MVLFGLSGGLLFISGAMGLTALACKQSTPPVSHVVPGLPIRFVPPPSPDTIVYERSISRANRDSSAGTRTVGLRVIAGPAKAQYLEVEQRFPSRGGEIVDTALAELPTLRAVAHRSHQPTRTMRFTFKGNEAEGTVVSHGPAGDSLAPVRQQIGGPIFDSNVLDLVVAALPLRAGFSAEVPFFIYERGGRVPLQVTVRERTAVTFAQLGRREAWVVTVSVPEAPATVWVDTRTGAVLRVRYDLASQALSFTDERVTPLPR